MSMIRNRSNISDNPNPLKLQLISYTITQTPLRIVPLRSTKPIENTSKENTSEEKFHTKTKTENNLVTITMFSSSEMLSLSEILIVTCSCIIAPATKAN
eukprot:jgi/Psemu1/56785/gm1.56785_g